MSPSRSSVKSGPEWMTIVATGCLAAYFVLSISNTARADLLAYEGFAYPVGPIDAKNGGTGWDTGVRTLGSGGTDASCDNLVCACPEDPSDTLVTHGHSGDMRMLTYVHVKSPPPSPPRRGSTRSYF